MTDAEIIKALNYCFKQGITSECEKCTVGNSCRSGLIISALDLISRQKAEIEKLNHDVEVLYRVKEQLKIMYKTAKTEAIKEFAERLLDISHLRIPQKIYPDDIRKIKKEMAGDLE